LARSIVVIRAIISDKNLHQYISNLNSPERTFRLGRSAVARSLFAALNYQGVSDAAAEGWLAKRGSPDFPRIFRWLESSQRKCSLLANTQSMETCGYRKLARTCARPGNQSRCMVPTVAARNGRLSRAAIGLASFMLEYAPNGIPAWIEGHRQRGERNQVIADALIAEFSLIPSVSQKVAAMLLSDLLLGASQTKPEWFSIGAEMVVVDRIVHGVLHRTGALKEFGVPHVYGPKCYQKHGCAAVIRKLAALIDARKFNRSYPSYFPRLIQHGLWQHGALSEAGMCNAVRIQAGVHCRNKNCLAFGICPKTLTQ